MDAWQKQYRRMEQRVAAEVKHAYADVEKWPEIINSRFSKDYLEGLADGLKRALLLIEAFKRRMPKNELEQKLDDLYEFTMDEEW